MISLLLAQKILTLFMMMAMGAVLVRTKLMKASDGKAISTVALYLIVPCSIFSAFQVEYSDQIRDGLILAAGVALLLHIGMIVLTELLSKMIKLMLWKKLPLFIRILEILLFHWLRPSLVKNGSFIPQDFYVFR